MATETKNFISLYYIILYELLQWQDRQNMSDFIIYFNIFDDFDNFEDWDAAQLINFCSWVALAPLLDNACRQELVDSAVSCKKTLLTNVFNLTLWVPKTIFFVPMCWVPKFFFFLLQK